MIWYWAYFNLNAHYFRASKWFGLLPCVRYYFRSLYYELVDAGIYITSLCSIWTLFLHPSSSSCGSSGFTVRLQKPCPLNNFVGFISSSYSCKEVSQFHLMSPGSFWINKYLTIEWGTMILAWDINKYGRSALKLYTPQNLSCR